MLDKYLSVQKRMKMKIAHGTIIFQKNHSKTNANITLSAISL